MTTLAAAVASFSVTSGFGLVLSIVVLSILCIAWLVTLFLVITDSIGPGAKLLWCVLATCLAPIAIPVYLILRQRRRGAAGGPTAAPAG